jgi:hypothetical protein
MSQVIADFGVNGAFPATVGGTGTAVKYFGRNVAYAAGATWTSPLTPSSSSAKGLLVVPGDNKLNGQKMSVQISGDWLTGAGGTSESVEVALYGVTGTLTAPTYTKLATTGAFFPAVDFISYSFILNVDLYGTSNSGVVGGSQSAYINNSNNTALGALTNSLTGISFGVTSQSPNQVPGALGGPFGLVVGVTFGASEAGNAANLYQFSISA